MPSLASVFGILLIVVGAGLAVFERRVLRQLDELRTQSASDSRQGRFLRDRSLRRQKIGLWILLLGVGMALGDTIDPHEHPILYLSSWSVAAITAVVLVRLATLDYIAMRRHWGGEILRNADELERARNELKRHISSDGEPPR